MKVTPDELGIAPLLLQRTNSPFYYADHEKKFIFFETPVNRAQYIVDCDPTRDEDVSRFHPH